MKTAAWVWILYLAALVAVDLAIYTSQPLTPILGYHLTNLLPALLFLGLSYSGWLKKQTGPLSMLMILLISAAPILTNQLFDPRLPPAPLSNLEGMALRQMPILMIGLVLAAWNYNLAVMALYSGALSLFELALVLALHRPGDPVFVVLYFIIIIRTVCFIVVGIFINQLVSYLRSLAVTDSLTGLHNRRRFFELGNMEVERAARYGRCLAVVMLDLDFFKQVNDTHGHLAGDRVLQTAAQVCRQTLRKTDIIGRYGGEEFAIIMPETSLENAAAAAGRVCEKIREIRFEQPTGTVRVTASLGLAFMKPGRAALETLLDQADKALYSAKSNGRNRVVVFNPAGQAGDKFGFSTASEPG